MHRIAIRTIILLIALSAALLIAPAAAEGPPTAAVAGCVTWEGPLPPGRRCATAAEQLRESLRPRLLVGTVEDPASAVLPEGLAVTVGRREVRLDAQGSFRAGSVRPGQTVRATAPGYVTAEVVFTGTSPLRLELRPLETTITVRDAYSGEALPGATVTHRGEIKRADDDGQVAWARLRAGEVLAVQADGHAPGEVRYAGEEAIDVKLRPTTLAGTVRGAGDAPVAGATVKATAGGVELATVETDEAGRFALAYAPERLSLRVTAKGYRQQEVAVERAVHVEVTLQRQATPTPTATPGPTVTVTPDATPTPGAGQTPAPGPRPGSDGFVVKGIYCPLGLLTRQDRVDGLLDLIDRTELNAIVIDMKNDAGWIGFPSQVPAAKPGLIYTRSFMDIKALVARCREKGIYTIARIVLFKDPLFARANPDWAVKDKDGKLWIDTEGAPWMDPFRPEVRDYLADLSREVGGLGFDEIQFDYVRFPSDGDITNTVYSQESTRESRTTVIREFCARLQRELKPLGVAISADVFGLTGWIDPYEDMGIGQRVIDIAPYMDYLSPMLYPGTFIRGNLGYAEPLKHPYDVVRRSVIEFDARTEAKIRPWVQHYSSPGVPYGPEEVRLQIQGAEDANAVGWMAWHAGGKYDAASFKPAE